MCPPQTFQAVARSSHLWLIGVLPPLAMILLVQGWANGVRGGTLPFSEMLALLAFAQAMPVVALAWMLCSVAGYSITPAQLIVHRVISDRTYPLPADARACALRRDVITVTAGRRRLKLFAADPEGCHAALCAAAEAAGTIKPTSRRG